MLLYLQAVCVWVALLVTVRSMWEVRVVLVEVVVVKGGNSYCEIPVEGNWNSIGVRSWLLP